MIELFKWLPDFESRLNGEYGDNGAEFGDFYRDYLQDTNICSSVFLWGMALTAIIVALYYFVGCNRWYKVSNRAAWLVTLLFTCILSFGITYTSVLGVDADEAENRTGVYFSADKTWENLRDGVEDENSLSEIDNIRDAYCEQFSNGSESLPVEMGLAMVLYSFILFFALSLAFKGHTTHGAGVPF